MQRRMAFTGEIVPGRGMLKVNGKSVIVCDSLGVAVIFEVFGEGHLCRNHCPRLVPSSYL